MNVTRNMSQLTVVFKQSGMELYGVRRGEVELELRVDLFPYTFHESLKLAVESGETTYPRVSLPFGNKQQFTLERQSGVKNDEVWFTLKTTSPGFFAIELREQEIRNLLTDMRKYMTR